MGRPIPNWCAAQPLITETLKLEETRFRKTLERGLGLLVGRDRRALSEGDMLDGETAFKLYDTYGFPLDLTQDALREPRHRASISTVSPPPWQRQKAEARAPLGRVRARRRTEAVWFDDPRDARARPNSSAMTPKRPKASCRRWSCDGTGDRRRCSRAKPCRSSSTRRRSTAKSGGQMGDHGEHLVRWRPLRRHRYAEEGRRALRPFRPTLSKAR